MYLCTCRQGVQAMRTLICLQGSRQPLRVSLALPPAAASHAGHLSYRLEMQPECENGKVKLGICTVKRLRTNMASPSILGIECPFHKQ
jgi:hypothetical protein